MHTQVRRTEAILLLCLRVKMSPRPALWSCHPNSPSPRARVSGVHTYEVQIPIIIEKKLDSRLNLYIINQQDFDLLLLHLVWGIRHIPSLNATDSFLVYFVE